MIANTQIRSDKAGPQLRGHSIDLEKVLVRSPIDSRHTKVRCASVGWQKSCGFWGVL